MRKIFIATVVSGAVVGSVVMTGVCTIMISEPNWLQMLVGVPVSSFVAGVYAYWFARRVGAR